MSGIFCCSGESVRGKSTNISGHEGGNDVKVKVETMVVGNVENRGDEGSQVSDCIIVVVEEEMQWRQVHVLQ